jgi:hypothetical protein
MSKPNQIRRHTERVKQEFQTELVKTENFYKTISEGRSWRRPGLISKSIEELRSEANKAKEQDHGHYQLVCLNYAKDKLFLETKTTRMTQSQKQTLAELTLDIAILETKSVEQISPKTQTEIDRIENSLRKIMFVLHQANTEDSLSLQLIAIHQLQKYEEQLVEWHLEAKPNQYGSKNIIDKRERLAELRVKLLNITHTYKELEQVAKLEEEPYLKLKYTSLAIDALMNKHPQNEIVQRTQLKNEAKRLWEQYSLQEIIIQTSFEINTAQYRPYTEEKQKLIKQIYDNPLRMVDRRIHN